MTVLFLSKQDFPLDQTLSSYGSNPPSIPDFAYTLSPYLTLYLHLFFQPRTNIHCFYWQTVITLPLLAESQLDSLPIIPKSSHCPKHFLISLSTLKSLPKTVLHGQSHVYPLSVSKLLTLWRFHHTFHQSISRGSLCIVSCNLKDS